MGCFLISFCLGNTPLPFGDGLIRHVQLLRQLPLGQAPFLPHPADEGAGLLLVHTATSFPAHCTLAGDERQGTAALPAVNQR